MQLSYLLLHRQHFGGLLRQEARLRQMQEAHAGRARQPNPHLPQLGRRDHLPGPEGGRQEGLTAAEDLLLHRLY